MLGDTNLNSHTFELSALDDGPRHPTECGDLSDTPSKETVVDLIINKRILYHHLSTQLHQ